MSQCWLRGRLCSKTKRTYRRYHRMMLPRIAMISSGCSKGQFSHCIFADSFQKNPRLTAPSPRRSGACGELFNHLQYAHSKYFLIDTLIIPCHFTALLRRKQNAEVWQIETVPLWQHCKRSFKQAPIRPLFSLKTRGESHDRKSKQIRCADYPCLFCIGLRKGETLVIEYAFGVI